jgi:hypothetical protein
MALSFDYLLSEVQNVNEEYARNYCSEFTSGQQVIEYLQQLPAKDVFVYPIMFEYKSHMTTKKCLFTKPLPADANVTWTATKNNTCRYNLYVIELLKTNDHYHTLLVTHEKATDKMCIYDPTGYHKGQGGYMMPILFDKLKSTYPWFAGGTLTNNTDIVYVGPQRHEGHDILKYGKGEPQGYCATWACVMGSIIFKTPSIDAQTLSEELVKFLIRKSDSTAVKVQVEYARKFIFRYQCKIMSMLFTTPAECNAHLQDGDDDDDDDDKAQPKKKQRTSSKKTKLIQRQTSAPLRKSSRPRRKCVDARFKYPQ